MKLTNICIIGIAEGKETEKGADNLLKEIIDENFPNLWKKTDIQVEEAQRVPNRMNPKRSTPRHIIKMAKIKDKDRILKVVREKQLVM